MNGKREKYVFLAVVLVITLLDQLTKWIIVDSLAGHQSLPLIRNVLHLTLVYNTGASFGMFKGMNLVFILLSFAVIAFFVKSYSSLPRPRIVAAVVLGGICGNLIDRIVRGYVIDFIDLRIWPIFNLADTCLTLGIIGLLILYSRTN